MPVQAARSGMDLHQLAFMQPARPAGVATNAFRLSWSSGPADSERCQRSHVNSREGELRFCLGSSNTMDVEHCVPQLPLIDGDGMAKGRRAEIESWSEFL